MGWVTLALRKQTLQRDISELTMRELEMSRKIRSVHRNLSYETSIFDNLKNAELRRAKEIFLQQADEENRPSRGDSKYDGNVGNYNYTADYNDWKDAYDRAKETYEEEKLKIQEYYEQRQQELEEEAQDQEDFINDQKTQVETQRQAEQAELEAITDEIKNEIQQSAIKF